MGKSTEWMLRVAAGVVLAWFGWQLVAATVIQMVNLSLTVKATKQALVECQADKPK